MSRGSRIMDTSDTNTIQTSASMYVYGSDWTSPSYNLIECFFGEENDDYIVIKIEAFDVSIYQAQHYVINYDSYYDSEG